MSSILELGIRSRDPDDLALYLYSREFSLKEGESQIKADSILISAASEL